MQVKLINLLEDIKFGRCTNFRDYLDNTDIEKISSWYASFTSNETTDFKTIINLIYELYIREDIDLKPKDEYKKITTYLADEYGFNCECFLDIYSSFRNL